MYQQNQHYNKQKQQIMTNVESVLHKKVKTKGEKSRINRNNIHVQLCCMYMKNYDTVSNH